MKSNRRQFMQAIGTSASGIAVAAAATSTGFAQAPKEAVDPGGQVLLVGDNIAVATTQYGKVRGYVLRGMHYFLGMPYGADTSGANRFMPPQKPKPWTEVYPALWWGDSAPQDMDNRYANKYASFRDHWNYGDVSEDCLRINVQTPAIGDGKKRPVMFWIHGGGYTNGNGIEQDGYNGENFARLGDVVFCSLNHRLGPLGFSNLAGVGPEDLLPLTADVVLAEDGIDVADEFAEVVVGDVVADEAGEFAVSVGMVVGGAGTHDDTSMNELQADSGRVFAELQELLCSHGNTADGHDGLQWIAAL